MADAIVILIVLTALAAAIVYIVRAKRRGVTCIGCPAADTCGKKSDPLAACNCSSNIDEIVQQIKSESDVEKK